MIALPDKAVLEINRSCDLLLQRREDRQIDRFLMVLAFSDKQPFILAVNRRYIDLRVSIQIVMPIRADSGGNERKLSAPAKLCKDVLADIFIRKRDKAADKGLLQLVQHDLLIVQFQFSLIRIDISEPEAGKVVRYKIQSFSGMLRILFRDRRVLHNKAQLGQCCQIRRDGGTFLLKNAADLTQLMIAVRNDPDDGEIIDRRLYLIAQQEVWLLV